MLSVVNISFGYDRLLFDELSISCASGEILGLTGPSEAGKTTLLNLIAGNLNTQSGTIRFCSMPPREAVQNQIIGLVPQGNTLLPNLTVRNNVALPLLLKRGVFTWRALTETDKKSVAWALEAAQIAHASDYYPSQLSGGMAARAMLARAVVHRPSLLLLDEAFANLDEVTSEGIYSSLQKIFGETGMIGIIVSHRIAEVVRLTSRVLVLRRPKSDGLSMIVHEEQVPLGWPRTASVLQNPVFLRACASVRANLGIGGSR